MRSIAEIKNSIARAFISNEVLQQAYGFESNDEFKEIFSKVSLENILLDIVSVSIWSLEKLFALHKSEVSEIIREQKPHTLRWYRNKARDFQYGFSLLPNNDVFDNTNATDAEIEESKIIKYAAVVESEVDRRLIVKIATETGGELTPITPAQEESFGAYMQEIKDAGVRLSIVNYLPDALEFAIRIFRDPMVIDANGVSILTGKKPVEEAIQRYLKELPFNGELIIQELGNALEIVEGVRIVQIDSVLTSWLPDSGIGGAQREQEPTYIDVRYVPVSGYFKVNNYNGITYVV